MTIFQRGEEDNWKMTQGAAHVHLHTTAIQEGTRQRIENVPPFAPIPIATILTGGKQSLHLSIDVENYALAGFEVWYKHSREATKWIKRASIAGDYTTPNFPVIKASGDLTAQAVGTGWLLLDTRGVYAVQIRAKCAPATAWAAATAYAVGTIRGPAVPNGLYRYKVIAVAGTGTSGGAEPAFPTSAIGATVIDNAGANQITWQAIPDTSIVTIQAEAA